MRLLLEVLDQPQQLVPGYGDRTVYQSLFEFEEGGTYLIRAIVDTETSPPTVVTVYRTSRIRKYWRIT